MGRTRTKKEKGGREGLTGMFDEGKEERQKKREEGPEGEALLKKKMEQDRIGAKKGMRRKGKKRI